MRNVLVLTLIWMVSATWVAAQQQGTTSPGASSGQATPPGASSSSSGQATPPGASSSSSGQATPPGASSSSSGQAPGAADSNIIEGCLGGSAPNFTVTDKAGTTYKLALPQDADSSPLSQHVGESVQVMGAVSDLGSSAGAPSGSTASASSANQRSIQVTKIGRGTGTCPGGTKREKPPTP
jgi:hypothetical protein